MKTVKYGNLKMYGTVGTWVSIFFHKWTWQPVDSFQNSYEGTNLEVGTEIPYSTF